MHPMIHYLIHLWGPFPWNTTLELCISMSPRHFCLEAKDVHVTRRQKVYDNWQLPEARFWLLLEFFAAITANWSPETEMLVQLLSLSWLPPVCKISSQRYSKGREPESSALTVVKATSVNTGKTLTSSMLGSNGFLVSAAGVGSSKSSTAGD